MIPYLLILILKNFTTELIGDCWPILWRKLQTPFLLNSFQSEHKNILAYIMTKNMNIWGKTKLNAIYQAKKCITLIPYTFCILWTISGWQLWLFVNLLFFCNSGLSSWLPYCADYYMQWLFDKLYLVSTVSGIRSLNI